MPNTLHALLIAINNYPIPRHRLNGCVADRNALKEYVERKFTNNPNTALRLKTLTDAEATKAGIIAAFSHFDAAQDGDTCLLFYSGHGSQAPAPREFWHLDPSHMCQSVVCYDSRVGGKDLMDKELSFLLWKATQGKKIHFIAVFDCCHSGTITREIGATPRMAEASPVPTRLVDFAGHENYQKKVVDGQTQISPPQGHYIQLAAAKDQETAKELKINGQTRGIFTYNLISLLEQSGDQLSYSDLVSSLRLRIEGKVREQTPQLISTEPADKQLRFLGGIAPAVTPGYNVIFSQDRWVVDAGTIQGIPAAGGTLKLGDGTILRLGNVGANRSEVSGMDGKDTNTTYKAEAAQLAVPALPIALAPEAESAGKTAIIQAASDLASPLIALVDPDKADFLIRAQGGSYRLTLPTDQRPLFRRVEGYTADYASIFLRDVEKVARWQNLLELTNPRSTIQEAEFKIQLYRVLKAGYFEDDAEVEEVNWREASQFRYDFINGKWEQPGFQLKITNTGNRTLYFSAINLEDNFKVSNRFLPMQELAPKSEGWLTDVFNGYPYKTIPLSLDDAYQSWGVTEKKEFIKVFISSDPQLSTDFYNQEGLELDVKKAEDTTRAGRGEQYNPNAPDWTSREIQLTTIRPLEKQKISDAQLATLVDKITIQPPSGFSANAVLATRGEGERSVNTSANLSELWGAQEVAEPYAFTQGMNGAPPLSVLELYEIDGQEGISAATPLTIDLKESLGERELIMPLGFDESTGLFYPIGSCTDDGAIHVETLPEPSPSGTRSLGGSVKIFFQKVVLSKLGYTYDYPQLAVADFDQKPADEQDVPEAFTYIKDQAIVKQKIEPANNILLFIHGIIGDTSLMARAAELAKDEAGKSLRDHYDLILTFDYENLNTPIEKTAKDFKDRLISLGLGPNHGKNLTVVAHSMGGLVSRWLVEKEGGNQMVNMLILVGTPNAGSPWADVYELASTLIGRAVNGAAFLKPYLIPLSLLGKFSKQIFITLQQMDAEKSAFLKNLNDGTDPEIPYAIIEGNTQLIPDTLEENQKAILKRIVSRFRPHTGYEALDKWLFKLANDIAVAVISIGNIPGKEKRKHPMQEVEVGCDHISYFADPAGLEGLAKVLLK